MQTFDPLLAAATHLRQSDLAISPVIIAGAVLIILGLIFDAVLIARYLPQPQFRVSPKPWSFRELGYAVVIFAATFLASNLLYSFLAGGRRDNLNALLPLIIPIEFALRLGMLAGFFYFFRSRRIQLREVAGLHQTGFGRSLAWGTAFALAALPPVGCLLLVSRVIFRLLHIPNTEQPIVEVFLTTQSTPLLIVLTLFAVVLAPVFEELLFRGFAYPVLKQRFGVLGSLLIVSALFALNHLHGPSLLPLFVLALGLGLAYELTGSLIASMVMHALFNGIMVLQVFYQRAHL